MADTTQVVQNQVGFAPQIAPYAETMLGQAQSLTDLTQNPYQSYTGDRYAQFTPLQKQSFEGAQQMQPAYQLMGASGLAGLAGQNALTTQYNPSNYQSQSILGPQGGFGAFGGMPSDGAYMRSDQPGAIPQQSNISAYMSPYMQNVVGVQQREAQRQADIAGTQQQANAVKSGAFGGGRDAIMRAEANRNLALQKGDIQAQGLQNAYTQAMNQFNTEQQARQQAAQLREQSGQFGAGLGLQGLQTALTGANTLGAIGQNQFQQGMDINKLQNTYGGQQQSQMQNILNAQYQTFQDQLNYPYKQLGFMSDILRGAPLTQTGSTVYGPAPSAISQIAGVGTAAMGAKAAGILKEGGRVSYYKDGGSVGTGLADLAIARMG